MATSLAPQESEYLFVVSSSSLIDAPKDKVWEILLDFPEYGKWNTFVRSIKLTSPSKNPLPDQTPVVGGLLAISVNMPPKLGEPSGLFGSGSSFCSIATLDHENNIVRWGTTGIPKWLLSSMRWQRLSVDEATGKTKYENMEGFKGLLAYLIKFLIAPKLRVGFTAAAESLKKKAEAS